MKVSVTHDENNQVFHAFILKQECYLKYRKKGPTMLEYFLTYVPPLLRGQRIASKIVEEALRHAQLNNLQIIPTCSFVASYMSRHPEYETLRVHDLDKIF